MFTINFVNYLLPKLIVRNVHSQIIKKKNYLKRKALSSLFYTMPFYVQKRKQNTYCILLWKGSV